MKLLPLIWCLLYVRWLKQKPILNLPENAIVMLDKASCHSVQMIGHLLLIARKI
jgi:hypothetical protein